MRRGDQLDDFEAVAYLAKVRDIFLALPQPCIRRLDAARPADELFATATHELDAALAEVAAL